jgi:uncharacterized delta-60 repeat protein
MKKVNTIVVLAFAVLAACNTSPVTSNLEGFKQPIVDAKKSQVLGVLEVELSSEQGSVSSAKFIPANAGLNAKGVAVPINGTNWKFTPGTTTFMTDASFKYLQNTITLENKTGISFSNLTMYALNTATNLGGTAFSNIKTLAGVPLTGTTADNTARAVMPTHGMGSVTTVDPAKADMMIYTPAEVAAVQAQLVAPGFTMVSPKVLEYGFVARNFTGTGRAIGTSAAGCPSGPTCNKAKITWAFKFPLSVPGSGTLGKFTMQYVVVNEPGTFATQSLEEQTAGTIAGLSTAASSSVSDWRTLGGTGIHDGKVNPVCGAITATGTGPVFMGTTRVSGELDACFESGGKQTLTFGATSSASLESLLAGVVQTDGKFVVAGFTNNFGTNDFAVVRYNRDGSLDSGFGTGGKVVTDFSSNDDYAYAVGLQSSAKIVVAGYTGSSQDFALARYNTDGSLDTTGFGTGGKVITNVSGIDYVSSLIVQPDNKIIVAGRSNDDFSLVRYNPDGSLDTTGFGTGGKVTTDMGGSDNINAIALQPNGKIVAVGYTYSDGDFAVARYNTDGSLDTAGFGGGTGKVVTPLLGQDQAHGVAIQTDGKIVVGGLSGGYPNYDFTLVRYNANGTLDSSFGTSGVTYTDLNSGSNDQGRSLAIQADGKILLAGVHGNGGTLSTFDFALVRYNVNGTLDSNFGTNGKVTTDFFSGFDSNAALLVPSNGRILSLGYAADGGGANGDFALARFNP